MYFDYGTDNNLFQIKINNNKFITDRAIESIDVCEGKIILKFRGVKFKYNSQDFFDYPDYDIIEFDKIYDYFTNEYHTILLEEFNRQGTIIKETRYCMTKCESIELLIDNLYKLTLKIPTKDDNFEY